MQRINEDVICILAKRYGSNQLEICYQPVTNSFEHEIHDICNFFSDDLYSTADILPIILQRNNLKSLLSSFDYCQNLTGVYQDLKQLSEEYLLKTYVSDYQSIENIEEKIAKIRSDKNRLLFALQTRVSAYIFGEAYNECRNIPSLLAISHRKRGWSLIECRVDSGFQIQFKTNFGYGTSSYFYTLIKYRGIDVVPFADWVLYRISELYEIMQYSSKHPVINESWRDAMTYSINAYQLYVMDEEKFIDTYIIDQFEKMLQGLRRILNSDHFQFTNFNFLNKEKSYVNVRITGHNLVEFRGEKISGALQFIPIIRLSKKPKTEQLIKSLEILNTSVLKNLLNEKIVLTGKTNNLKINIKTLAIKLERLNKINLEYETKINQFKLLLIRKGSALQFDYQYADMYRDSNPQYTSFLAELANVSNAYHTNINEQIRLEQILNNIGRCIENINEYFLKREP